MGGHALSRPSMRVTAKNYARISQDILKQLNEVLPNRLAIVPAYYQKPDFGDIDIVVNGRLSSNDFLAIDNTGIFIEKVRNGPVTSYAYPLDDKGNVFQVDIITTDTFDFTLSYFSFNDLGNFIGRAAHYAGFKFGHNGLFYIVRSLDNSNHVLGEILLTCKWDEALTFLRYDAANYLRGAQGGFQTLRDIFTFTASSAWFRPESVALENRNHIARMRDKKRPNYVGLVKWLNDSNLMPSYLTDAEKEKAIESKREHRKMALSLAKTEFPNFAVELARIFDAEAQNKLVKEKFSGKEIATWTGLTGKALGEFFAAVKNQFSSKEEFQNWVLSSTTQDIQQAVLNWMSSFTPQ